MEHSIKYYYFVGVRARISNDLHAKLSCDFVLPYTSEDFDNFELASEMVSNEMFPTSMHEAIEATNLTDFNTSVNALSLRCRFNPDITIHKFISQIPLEPEWFYNYIDFANNSEEARKKLMEARIYM